MERLLPGSGTAMDPAERPLDAALPGEAAEAGPPPPGCPTPGLGAEASGLLELLDEGWFTGNVWSGGGWSGGGFSLSTIKEAQNEADEQGEDDEEEQEQQQQEVEDGDEEGAAVAGKGRRRDGQGGAEEGGASCRGHGLALAPPYFSSPAQESAGCREGCLRDRDSRDRLGQAVEAEAAAPGGARWKTSSPYSSDEEPAQVRQGRRRGRSGARRRTKRSSSAENARVSSYSSWFGEQPEGPLPGGGRVGRLVGSNTPPPVPTSGKGEERGLQPRFLRTRSVSDYDARGPRVTSLWDTPPGSRSKAKSLTDADVEELQGFLDLGFKFQQDQISPRITAALPALRLYHVVGTVQQRILQKRQPGAVLGDSAADSTSPAALTTSEASGNVSDSSTSSTSLPNESTWSIADPSDNPVDVKNNLRLWAQAVASTVRQTC